MTTIRQAFEKNIRLLESDYLFLASSSNDWSNRNSGIIQSISDCIGSASDEWRNNTRYLEQVRGELLQIRTEFRNNNLDEVALHMNDARAHLLRTHQNWDQYLSCSSNGAQKSTVIFSVAVYLGLASAATAYKNYIGSGLFAVGIGVFILSTLFYSKNESEVLLPNQNEIHEAQEALEYFKVHRELPHSFHLGQFLINAFVHSGKSEFSESERLQSLNSYENILSHIDVSDTAPPLLRRNSILEQLFLISPIRNYVRGNDQLINFFVESPLSDLKGGACAANTAYLAAVYERFDIQVPDETFGIQVYPDHLEAVSWNCKNHRVRSLMTGALTTSVAAPIYRIEILLYSYLLSNGIVPPIEEQELLLARANTPHHGSLELHYRLGGMPFSAHLFNPNDSPIPEQASLDFPNYNQGEVLSGSPAPASAEKNFLIPEQLNANEKNAYELIQRTYHLETLRIDDGYIFPSANLRAAFQQLNEEQRMRYLQRQYQRSLDRFFHSESARNFTNILQRPGDIAHFSERQLRELSEFSIAFLGVTSHPFQSYSDLFPTENQIYINERTRLQNLQREFYRLVRRFPNRFIQMLDRLPWSTRREAVKIFTRLANPPAFANDTQNVVQFLFDQTSSLHYRIHENQNPNSEALPNAHFRFRLLPTNLNPAQIFLSPARADIQLNDVNIDTYILFMIHWSSGMRRTSSVNSNIHLREILQRFSDLNQHEELSEDFLRFYRMNRNQISHSSLQILSNVASPIQARIRKQPLYVGHAIDLINQIQIQN